MTVAVWVLLSIAMLSVLLTAAGVLLSQNAYQRLHFLAPASTLGAVAVAAAIVVRESWGQIGIKAVLTVAILFVMNPILTHATARAVRIHRQVRRERGEQR